ncbi:MAG: hypothetical protein KGM43_01165 [Planctomycetota bacterium]|nr:hypothetical protein [Planctomycetota bacterium]
MSTVKDRALAHLLRYGLGLLATICPEENRKSVESAIARLIAEGMVCVYPFFGNKKIYAPSPKAARLQGLDPKRFMRPPGPQAISDRLTIAMFCQKKGVELLTRGEFATSFPEQAECSGICHSRYFRDTSKPQPMLTVIVPDYGSSVRRTARKARREIDKRKKHEAFRDLIYFNLFQVALVTLFDFKARAIAEALKRDTFPKTITVIPELADLLLLGAKP